MLSVSGENNLLSHDMKDKGKVISIRKSNKIFPSSGRSIALLVPVSCLFIRCQKMKTPLRMQWLKWKYYNILRSLLNSDMIQRITWRVDNKCFRPYPRMLFPARITCHITGRRLTARYQRSTSVFCNLMRHCWCINTRVGIICEV